MKQDIAQITFEAPTKESIPDISRILLQWVDSDEATKYVRQD